MSQYTIPHVVDRSGNSEKIIDVYSHLLGNRIIYLGVPIDDGVANTVIAQLLHLEASSHELPIQMYINSPGGSLTAMTAIFDAMGHIGAPVATTPRRRCTWNHPRSHRRSRRDRPAAARGRRDAGAGDRTQRGADPRGPRPGSCAGCGGSSRLRPRRSDPLSDLEGPRGSFHTRYSVR